MPEAHDVAHPVVRTPESHALLDIGDGRRLDRFGDIIVDRPCPPADVIPRSDPAAWRRADARFERRVDGGVSHAGWTTTDGRPIEPWVVREGPLTFELRLTGSGQVGLFPEQADDRVWIRDRVVRLAADDRMGGGAAPSILVLFAYTGGATLAAIAGGGRPTHVDAARGAVAWARRNADLSGLGDHPARWIADDAVAFARREARRGRTYAGIVLDPPSYGHGPRGRDWRLERDLPELLVTCAGLLDARAGAFVRLTAHTPSLSGPDLGSLLDEAFAPRRGTSRWDALALEAVSGERLALGWSIRWQR